MIEEWITIRAQRAVTGGFRSGSGADDDQRSRESAGHEQRYLSGNLFGIPRRNGTVTEAGRQCNNQPRPEAVVLGRPPEGADYVRLPPLGAWSWSGPSFLPGTGRGFSVDDDFQAYPLSCESLPKP